VTDRPDRLAGLEEGTNELHRVGIGAQLIGVGDASRQHQTVVAVGVRLTDRSLGGEGPALVEMVERLDLVVFGREQIDLRPRLAQRLERTGQLDFLNPLVGNEDRDLLPLQPV